MLPPTCDGVVPCSQTCASLTARWRDRVVVVACGASAPLYRRCVDHRPPARAYCRGGVPCERGPQPALSPLQGVLLEKTVQICYKDVSEIDLTICVFYDGHQAVALKSWDGDKIVQLNQVGYLRVRCALTDEYRRIQVQPLNIRFGLLLI
jgi:hypothetical protein